MVPKIAIGIITYKRSVMLGKALQGICTIEKPDPALLEVIVVDNDEMGSARRTVAAMIENLCYPLHYLVEGKRGIPFARNAVIKKAMELGATELTFIDDDEVVDKNWLKILYGFYKGNPCDAVAGPVEPLLPKNTPEWMFNTRYFQRKKVHTGVRVPCAATGNILFSMNVFTRYGLLFDTRFALGGGTDTLLTRQLTQKGGKILWLDEALVKEEVPPSKVTMRWLLARSFRRRINDIKFDFILKGKAYAYFFSYLSLFKNLIYAFAFLILALLHRKHLYSSLDHFAVAGATIAAVAGFSYNEYNRIHGY